MADVSGTGLTASEFSQRLLFEHGVALLDGAFFGKHGAGLVRISFAQSRERLSEACDRIASFVESVAMGHQGTSLTEFESWPEDMKSPSSLRETETGAHSLTSLSEYDVHTEL